MVIFLYFLMVYCEIFDSIFKIVLYYTVDLLMVYCEKYIFEFCLKDVAYTL